MAEVLRYGDYICLRDIKAKEYLSAEGILSDELIVGKGASFDDEWFQVCLQRQYSAFIELEDFYENEKEEAEKEVNGKLDIEVQRSKQNHLNALRRGLVNEEKMNNMYMKNKFGEPVHYGDHLQLLHVKSKKYVTIEPTEVSPSERENIKVLLHPKGTSCSWLVIQPRYRINKLGDVVITNSEIKLNIAERMNEYLHTSEVMSPTSDSREVNSSLNASSWLMNIFQSSVNSKNEKLVLTSQLVYLFDPETLSNLSIFQRPAIIQEHGDDASVVSDDDSIMDVSEEGEIVMEPMDNVVNTNALWVLESKQMLTGGPIQCKGNTYRLKHVNTGKYMCMSTGNVDGFDELYLTVSSLANTKGTLFSIQALHSQNEFLMDKKAVHISHNGAYLERGSLREISNISHHCCKAGRSKHSALYLFISVYKESQGFDDDPVKRQLLQSQPLDVYVGASIKRTLQFFLDALPNFTGFSLKNVHDPRFRDRIWASLDDEDDELFYVVVEKTIKYLRGHPISTRISPLDDDSIESQDVINEFGEIVRDDYLINVRQNMCCDQGILDMTLILLNHLLPLYIGDNADYDEDEDSEYDSENETTKRTRLSTIDVLDDEGIEMSGNFEDSAHTEFADVKRRRVMQVGNEKASSLKDNEIYVKRKSLLHMGNEVAKCLLRLLFQLVQRNNANQLKVAHHLHVILGWVKLQPAAAAVVKEILSDNLELQLKYISENEIEVFTSQISEPDAAMKSMYLEMLQAFCSCGGHGINKNQGIVLDFLNPTLDDLFFKIRMDGEDSTETKLFNSALYFPRFEDKTSLGRILGGKVLTKGSPKIYISWSSPHDMYNVYALFGMHDVPISELCRAKVRERNKTLRNKAVRNGSMDRLTKDAPVKPAGGRALSFSASRKYSFAGNLTKIITDEKKDMVCDYFIAQLHLAADLCSDRNYTAIDTLHEKFPYEVLVTILSGKCFSVVNVGSQACLKLQGASARLLCSMYVDRESESTCRMPMLTRLWTNTTIGTIEVVAVGQQGTYRFALLQQIISEFMQGVINDDCQYPVHMLHVVHTLKKLLELKYYGNIAKLQDVITPILIMLDRRKYDVTAVSQEKNKMNEVIVKPVIPWQKLIFVYLDTVKHLAIILGVVLVATIVTITQIVVGVESIGFDIFEYMVFVIFASEVSLRGYCHHFLKGNLNRFINDGFVRLDVGLVVLDVIVMTSSSSFGAFGGLSKTLKALRILRVARILKAARLLNKEKKVEEKEKWVLPERYRKAPAHELKTMQGLIEALNVVQEIIHDRNISSFLHGLSKWDVDGMDVVVSGTVSSGGAGMLFHNTPDAIFEKICNSCAELKVVGSDDDDETLLDLVMYVNPPLVQSVLELIQAHHSTYASLLQSIEKVQILASTRREKQFDTLQRLLLQIDRNIETFALWGDVRSSEGKEKSSRTINMIYSLRDHCRIERKVLEFDHDHEPDKEVQIMLRNLGWWEIAEKLLKRLHSAGEQNVMTEAWQEYKGHNEIMQ